jgi:hypothetical protein
MSSKVVFACALFAGGAALCVGFVLAGDAVRANTAWTDHLASGLKAMEGRLSFRLVHRGNQKADQLAVPARDRDDYVQLLASIGDAQIPSRP